MIGNFEFTDDLIERYYDYPIVPHVREWIWAYIEDHAPQSLLYAFDNGDGPMHVPNVIADACQAYMYDLSDNERMSLHDKCLKDLSQATCRVAKHLEWTNMIGTSLLATLNEFAGVPREEKIQFDNAIRTVMKEVEMRQFQLACDLDDEQEWEPSVFR